MQMYRKKKIEMVVDTACVQQLLHMCERVGAKGYSIIPNVSGKGHRGVRSGEDIFDVFRNVLITVIVAEPVAMKIVEESQQLLANYAGIVYVSDVEVVRDDHF